jgi:hypothetical protein
MRKREIPTFDRIQEDYVNTKPSVRVFAPELWGELQSFAKFYHQSFQFTALQQRAVSGAVNHFQKSLRFHGLALKLKPNINLDLEELNRDGYTPAVNSYELSAVIESIFTELYSSVDCTRKILSAIYSNNRGLPTGSTRKLFQKIRQDRNSVDLPEVLINAIESADWYEELLHIRDELTHSDTGTCYLNDKSGKIEYMHTGINNSGKPLIIDDIFEEVEKCIHSVNAFLGKTYNFLNSLLSREPVPQLCGIFFGRGYMRQVVPAEVVDINSGTCISHTWFELEENPTCPLACSCGAYKKAKASESGQNEIETCMETD